MAQSPPDSQPATRSHSSSLAALTWPASARPLPLRTAPETAILAAIATHDVVGLRCRPLMSACRPLCADSWVVVLPPSVGFAPPAPLCAPIRIWGLWSGPPLSAVFVRQRFERARSVLRGCRQYRELVLIAWNPSETTSYRCGTALPR